MASSPFQFSSPYDRSNIVSSVEPPSYTFKPSTNASSSFVFGARPTTPATATASFHAGSPLHSANVSGSGGPEPMALGSPSPPSAQFSSHSQYLPGYLLGDTPVKSSSKGFPSATTSATSPRRLFNSGGLGSSTGSRGLLTTPLRGNRSPRTEDSRNKESASNRSTDKPGAPPVHSLFDVSIKNTSPPINSSNLDLTDRRSLQFAPNNRSEILNSSHVSYSSPAMFSRSANRSMRGGLSPTQLDPFYTQGESMQPGDVLDDMWVTVFGFPSTALRFVLQQFSQYGTILHHVAQNEGNWMHIHYQSKIQAKNALSKNGKVIGDNIMVGVRQCIDMEVMGMADKEGCTPPKRKRVPAGGELKPSTPIRPLTAAYRAAAMKNEVVRASNTPTKNNGIISKTMEYLFGW